MYSSNAVCSESSKGVSQVFFGKLRRGVAARQHERVRPSNVLLRGEFIRCQKIPSFRYAFQEANAYYARVKMVDR